MTKNCAIQYIPEKIRVNAVAPTAIDNDMLKVKHVSKPERLKNIIFLQIFNKEYT